MTEPVRKKLKITTEIAEEHDDEIVEIKMKNIFIHFDVYYNVAISKVKIDIKNKKITINHSISQDGAEMKIQSTIPCEVICWDPNYFVDQSFICFDYKTNMQYPDDKNLTWEFKIFSSEILVDDEDDDFEEDDTDIVYIEPYYITMFHEISSFQRMPVLPSFAKSFSIEKEEKWKSYLMSKYANKSDTTNMCKELALECENVVVLYDYQMVLFYNPKYIITQLVSDKNLFKTTTETFEKRKYFSFVLSDENFKYIYCNFETKTFDIDLNSSEQCLRVREKDENSSHHVEIEGTCSFHRWSYRINDKLYEAYSQVCDIFIKKKEKYILKATKKLLLCSYMLQKQQNIFHILPIEIFVYLFTFLQ